LAGNRSSFYIQPRQLAGRNM